MFDDAFLERVDYKFDLLYNDGHTRVCGVWRRLSCDCPVKARDSQMNDEDNAPVIKEKA